MQSPGPSMYRTPSCLPLPCPPRKAVRPHQTHGPSPSESTMSKSFCKAQILGVTGADPILATLSNGTATASINIATSVDIFDPGVSRYIERTIWHHVVAFGPRAADIRNNVTKGCRVYIEGVLYPEVYQDRDNGKTLSRTRLVASSVILLQDSQRHAQVAPHLSITQPPILPQTDATQSLDSEWDGLPL